MGATTWFLLFALTVTGVVARNRCACIKKAQTAPVNECANPALNNCDQNAMCQDLPNGFSCTCNAGFIGDGTTCTELCNGVPCDEGENRVCYMDQSCLCNLGFHELNGACVETCATYDAFSSIVYPDTELICGSPILTIPGASAPLCQAICQGEPACISGHFQASTSSCILYACDPLDGSTSVVAGDVLAVKNCVVI